MPPVVDHELPQVERPRRSIEVLHVTLQFDLLSTESALRKSL
jgi:hypothetical protein